MIERLPEFESADGSMKSSSELSPSPSLAKKDGRLSQKLRCRCRTGARMLVQFALLISTWIAAVQCLATVEALAKCGEGKPGRGMRFTQKYSMEVSKFPGIWENTG